MCIRDSPIAGQGLNAGFKDIAVLAQVIEDAFLRGEDFGSLGVLKRYEEWRKFDSVQLAYSTDLFNKLFSNENEALRLVRNIGMKMLDSIPIAKQKIIKEAAGLTGFHPYRKFKVDWHGFPLFQNQASLRARL